MVSTAMDKIHRSMAMKEKGVKDILTEEGVDRLAVRSEAAVVYMEATGELVAVEVTLWGSGGVNKDISCGGGGGSFNHGTNQQNECCYNSAGHGRVIITFFK